MEVTAGARTDRRELDLRNMLLSYELLHFDPVIDFDGATTIYRQCRKAGITPRGLIDCMIASVASRHDVSVLSADTDLVRIAPIAGFELDRCCPDLED